MTKYQPHIIYLGWIFLKVSLSIKNKTTIEYGSISPHSPTNADIVQVSMDYFIKATTKMGQMHTVITCDQAIYDILKGKVKIYVILITYKLLLFC